MRNRELLILTLILGLILAGIAMATSQQQNENIDISGELIQGYRVLSIKSDDQVINFNVYRGDYIKFDFDGEIQNPVLEIPALSVKQRLTGQIDDAPYFKMKTAGRFRFTLGSVSGHIKVAEYKQPYYRAVDAKQAAQILKEQKPLLLDVRTRREFKRGHIPDAKLIPVQELQTRLKELSAYKHTDILIYCATGNRSTVASKILIDNGFKRIINMRHGIAQWSRNKYQIVK
jgi:rhodanese-related sulfurtransferase